MFPGHSQILPCSCGEIGFSPQLLDKIWRWSGNKANGAVHCTDTHGTRNFAVFHFTSADQLTHKVHNTTTKMSTYMGTNTSMSTLLKGQRKSRNKTWKVRTYHEGERNCKKGFSRCASWFSADPSPPFSLAPLPVIWFVALPRPPLPCPDSIIVGVVMVIGLISSEFSFRNPPGEQPGLDMSSQEWGRYKLALSQPPPWRLLCTACGESQGEAWEQGWSNTAYSTTPHIYQERIRTGG